MLTRNFIVADKRCNFAVFWNSNMESKINNHNPTTFDIKPIKYSEALILPFKPASTY